MNIRTLFLLYLVNPLLSFYYGLKTGIIKFIKFNIIGLTLFFALTISIGETEKGYDIERNMQEVEALHNDIWLNESIFSYYSDSGEIDVGKTIIAYVISRFTGNGMVLILVYALFYGIFLAANWTLVFKRSYYGSPRVSVHLKFYLFALFLAIPFWYMNGFRFWMASHFYIYYLLPSLLGTNERRVWPIILTPLFWHFSFIVPVMVYFLFRVTNRSIHVGFLVLLIGLLFNGFNAQIFEEFARTSLGQPFSSRLAGYISSESIEAHMLNESDAGLSWHKRFRNDSVIYAMSIYLVGFYGRYVSGYKSVLRNKEYHAFLMFFLGVSLVSSNLPSGGRFITVVLYLFISYLLVYQIQFKKKPLFERLIMVVITPLIMFHSLLTLRIGLYLMSLTTFIGNPIIAIFTVWNNWNLDELLIR